MFDLRPDDGSVRKKKAHDPIKDAPEPKTAKQVLAGLDRPEMATLHKQLLDYYARELDRQHDNRLEMAQDADFYDNIQWDEADAQMLRDVSPVFHADRIRKPLIVLQGANDPRVIKPESDDIVAAVKKNGVPVEYVVFPDEGHGFTKKKNQIEGYSAVLKFLDRYLKGTTGTPSAGR